MPPRGEAVSLFEDDSLTSRFSKFFPGSVAALALSASLSCGTQVPTGSELVLEKQAQQAKPKGRLDSGKPFREGLSVHAAMCNGIGFMVRLRG